MAYSLRARVVFPVDRPPIEGGTVTIDNERITAVGTATDGDLLDLGNVALFPGFVNAHTHLEFSHLQRPLGSPGMPLAGWIRQVIAERARQSKSIDATVMGLKESAQFGVTTICDIASEPYAPTSQIADDLTIALEVIAFSRARASSALSATIARLDSVMTGRGPVHYGISPHAPYTVSPQLLSDLIALAKTRGVITAMHLAESRDEIDFLKSGSGPFQELLDERSMWDADSVPRGSRPLDYLRMLAAAPRSLVIHGNYLDDDELQFMATHADRMALVYCPRTHAFFRHRPYPLHKALSAKVRVALGTDSRASNPNLDLLSEMRHVAATHTNVDCHAILKMGTLSGAEALGRAHEVGSLTIGKRANLVAVPISETAESTPAEMLRGVLTSRESPSAVIQRGRMCHRCE